MISVCSTRHLVGCNCAKVVGVPWFEVRLLPGRPCTNFQMLGATSDTQQCLDGAKVVFRAQWFDHLLGHSSRPPTQNIFRAVTKQTSNKCIETQAIWDLVFSAAIFKIWITFEMPPTQQRMNRMEKLKNKKSSNESSFLPFIGFICKISPSRLAGNDHQQPSQQCSLFAGPCSSNSGQVSTYGGVA